MKTLGLARKFSSFFRKQGLLAKVHENTAHKESVTLLVYKPLTGHPSAKWEELGTIWIWSESDSSSRDAGDLTKVGDVYVEYESPDNDPAFESFMRGLLSR